MLLAGLLPAIADVTPAQANDRDLRATMVSGASCTEVARSTFNNPWTSGDYFAVSSVNQFLKLRCPLPLNQVDLSGTTNDNDISKIRVFYADSDGFGTDAGVAVELVRITMSARAASPQTTVVGTWSSDTDGTGAVTAAKATKACVHDLAAEAFYHFTVTLRTGAGGGNAATFVGIGFP
ncbi:MAG: hypothetical protein AB7I59_06350 [Geminicoccaceae bacterium]